MHNGFFRNELPELSEEDECLINQIKAVILHDGSGIIGLRAAHEKLIATKYINELGDKTLSVLDKVLYEQGRHYFPSLYIPALPNSMNPLRRTSSALQYGNENTEPELHFLYTSLIQAVKEQLELRVQREFQPLR